MQSFSQRVCSLALLIPEGRVVTYGTLAKAAGGGRQSARSVSSILGRYPNQGAIPWHRIVYANGRAYLSAHSEVSRRALYAREGIHVDARGYIKNFHEVALDVTELTSQW